jgi:Flp pilus assembly protein TadD
MKRISLIAIVSLLTACASQDSSRLKNGQPGLNIAQAALAGGSPDIALNVSNGILAKAPHDVPALLSQGEALSALDRLDEAEASYTKALAAAPHSVGAQIGLGRLRLRSDPGQAQVLFLSVLEREPRNKIALNDLGIAYDLQGKHASAQGSYRKALGVDPAMRAAEVNLALSMALSGQASEAVRILRPLAKAPGTSKRERHDLGMALALAGDDQEAVRVLGEDMTAEQIEHAVRAYQAFGS